MLDRPCDFVNMPSKGGEDMLLRCRFCLKTPAKARPDGCPARQLEEDGQILLGDWNPRGTEYFKDRFCVTCERPIMSHWLRKGSDAYWCDHACSQESAGVNDCVTDVENVVVPVELPVRDKNLAVKIDNIKN